MGESALEHCITQAAGVIDMRALGDQLVGFHSLVRALFDQLHAQHINRVKQAQPLLFCVVTVYICADQAGV